MDMTMGHERTQTSLATVRVRMMYRQDKTRLCAPPLMWMSVEMVVGVRVVQCHAIMNVVIGVRVMQYHAITDVVIGVRVMLCHQPIMFNPLL